LRSEDLFRVVGVGWCREALRREVGGGMTAAAMQDTATTFALIEEMSTQVRRLKPGDILVTCPISGERSASCHVTLKADGKLVVYCFSCQRDAPDHLDAFGLPMAALSPEPRRNYEHGSRSGARVLKPLKALREPRPPKEPECLGRYREHGYPMVGQPDRPSRGESWFVHEWSPGCPVAWKVRQTCVRCGERTFHWRQPDGRGRTKSGKPAGVIPLVGLWELYKALDAGELVHVYLTEGDSDAIAVRQTGQLACTAGGVTDWRPEHYDQLDGVAFATICADRDEPGRAHAREVKAQLKARRIRSCIVEPIVGKDVRDHLQAGHSLSELVAVS
jgi:hypothetical protein